jgi:dCTP deaminase
MILKDGDLKTLIQRHQDPLLTDYDVPADWTDKDSLTQPSSLDLHIGEIFEPGIKPGRVGSAGHPKSELVLRTGQTAIVVTQETINLAADYAGFGFPPAHVSSRALLMTNPGHIDPGYSGKLRFTVINMGRETFVLRSKDLIVTLLIFKLDSSVDSDYKTRHPNSVYREIEQQQIDALSPDFLDVEKRARSIAKRTLGLAGIIATILAGLSTWAVNALNKRVEVVDELKVRLTRIEDANMNLSSELRSTKEQLEKQIDVERRLAVLEAKSRAKTREAGQ